MGKFNEQLVNAGVLLAGDGLQPSSQGFRVYFSGHDRTIVDGPFAETKELLAGYWLIEVASREEAIEWVRRCPNPQYGGETYVEVRRVFEISDFPEESFSTPDAAAARDLEILARLVRDVGRAKRTLAEARVPFAVPRGDALRERIASAFRVIYLIFNEGYAATTGDEWMRPSLCDDALRIGRVLAALAPDVAGEPILLLDQQRQVSIAACHAHARRADETDWVRIAALYDALAVVAALTRRWAGWPRSRVMRCRHPRPPGPFPAAAPMYVPSSRTSSCGF